MNGSDFASAFAEATDRIYGVVVGIVKSNKLDAQGQIEIRLPRLTAAEIGHAARVATLMAGDQRGTLFLPEEGDEVLVVFESGDISKPYVIGALWNGKDKPPETNSDGKNNLRLIKSRSGNQVRLDDTSGAEKIEIIDNTGKNKITIDTAANTITLESEKDVVLKAPKGKITLEAQSVEIQSQAETAVHAKTTLNVEADATLTVKGQTVNIN